MADKHRTKGQRALQALLRDIRVEADLTQCALAERLKKPQSYVSKYESGERKLDLPEIRSVCLAAKITLVNFIRRYERSLR